MGGQNWRQGQQVGEGGGLGCDGLSRVGAAAPVAGAQAPTQTEAEEEPAAGDGGARGYGGAVDG
eukprot:SAG11_NODE_1039_length_6074_cov_11.968870_4_plen_64_part_00